MVIMEPVQNAGGSFTPPEGYFQGVREICDRYGVLLCADEVITAFGRLGARCRLGEPRRRLGSSLALANPVANRR